MPPFSKTNVVCFGGGTGMPSLLSGLKRNPWLDVTAIVTMFDNGGSSGVLRDKYGILPPSDVLRCVLALSEDEAAARRILLRRITNDAEPNHTGGNLLLFALEKVYGNYDDAVAALCQVLSANGKVVPVTQERSSLGAQFEDGSSVSGETAVDDDMRDGKRIKRLFLEPAASANPAALEAIRSADALVAGPGSLYTSVLPTFLPEGISSALKESSAPFIFISNLLIEGQGMDGTTVLDVVREVEAVAGRKVDVVLANDRIPSHVDLAAYAYEGKKPLELNEEEDPRVLTAQLWTDPDIARHDPVRLAELVFSVINRFPRK